MKVSVVCRKFQRKEQRGGILLREQRLASVYISALWNSHRQYTQSTRFIFLRKSGRWSRKESLGPLTRNAVTLGSWLELQLKLNTPFAKTPQSQSASLLGEPATALNTPLPSPQGRASRVPWISLAQFIFAGLWLILYFTHWNMVGQWALYNPDEEAEVLAMSPRRNHGFPKLRVSSSIMASSLEMSSCLCSVPFVQPLAASQGSLKSFTFSSHH